MPYWGRGLIPEAVEALLKRCFTELDCRRVWCVSFEGNQRSERVQEKCGFIYQRTIIGEPNPYCGIAASRVSCLTRTEWEAREQ